MAILKIILVVMLLLAMVVLLLGIGHLSNGRFETDASDIDKLRDDVDNREDVISKRSIFHEFLEGTRKEKLNRR
jgi:hypothetical protein